MEEFMESSYDENDIEDFEEYLHYYGFDDDESDSTSEDDDDEEIDSEIRELYF